jgi:hypothetical protein
MADFLVPIKLEICIKDISEDNLQRYIDDFIIGLNQMFMSDDPNDDHFRIMEATPRYSQIKETEYVD